MQALSALLLQVMFLSPLLPGTGLTIRQFSCPLDGRDRVHAPQFAACLSWFPRCPQLLQLPPRCRNTAEMMDLDDEDEEPQLRPVHPLITANSLTEPAPTFPVVPRLTEPLAPHQPLYQRLCMLRI